MDVTTCLKSSSSAIQQYRESRSAQHTAQSQKQVEEVSSLKCDSSSSSGQFSPTECVSGSSESAGDPNTSPASTSSIISSSAQMGSDDASREALHSSYNSSSTSAAIVHCHRNTPGQPSVSQCLQVSQKLTYNTHTFQFTNHIQELIGFLSTNIQSQNEDVVMPCLGLMASSCRNNPSVQCHVKSTDNLKQFYHTLICFSGHNSSTVVIFSSSISASLTMNEKVGEKLFDSKNIHQTFQLVFNIIVNGDGTSTRKYSVDLLIDLLKNPKIADYLTRYQHFSACASRVLGSSHLKDPESAAMVSELLLAMCGVAGVRSQLCEVVFRPAGPRLRAAGAGKPECGSASVQWSSSPVEGAEKCSSQTSQSSNESSEETSGAESVSGSVSRFVEMSLPVAVGSSKGSDPAQGDAHLRKHCQRITHVYASSLTLCCEDATRCSVSSQVSAQLCVSQVEMLLSCCHGNNPFTCSPAVSGCDLSQLCSEASSKTSESMSRSRQQVKDMETSFYRMSQDQRTVTPLSSASTSPRSEHVQTGLASSLEATPLPDFPSSASGESIAANNAYRQREAESSAKRVAVQDVPPPRTNTSVMDASSGYRSVSNSVEKIQTGSESQEQTKDSPLSEIINVYEQKLAGFASKESRLQDLSETKALALSQADRLIAQYQLQRAQAEAEARKSAGLSKDAERRREGSQGESSNKVSEMQRSKAEIDESSLHNVRSQRDSEEHQTSKGTYNTSLNRFNETERSSKESQAAHASSSKQNDTLRKNLDALQQQKDKVSSESQEREEQVRSLQMDLEKKNSDITGLLADSRSKEETSKEKDQERRESEETVDVLRKESNRTEQARKDASIKASSSESQKSQSETKLKQKEDELNKHSAMIAMIHSLSSGKSKSDVNSSL